MVHVTTGTAVLTAWDSQRFDVVLMDMQMPEIDGLEATRRIRAREGQRGGHTPIVALTANALKDDEQRCRDAGMADYLAKPIEIDRFLRVLARILPAQPATTPAPPARTSRPAQRSFDAGALFTQLGDDREIVAAVVATFLDTERSLLAGIEDALAAGDLRAIERAAHHARGSLLALQARPAATAAQAIELAARNGERHRLEAATAELRDAWSELVAALAAAGLASG